MQNHIHIRYEKLLKTFSGEDSSRWRLVRVVLRIVTNNRPFSVLQGKGCLGLKRATSEGKAFLLCYMSFSFLCMKVILSNNINHIKKLGKHLWHLQYRVAFLNG